MEPELRLDHKVNSRLYDSMVYHSQKRVSYRDLVKWQGQ